MPMCPLWSDLPRDPHHLRAVVIEGPSVEPPVKRFDLETTERQQVLHFVPEHVANAQGLVQTRNDRAGVAQLVRHLVLFEVLAGRPVPAARPADAAAGEWFLLPKTSSFAVPGRNRYQVRVEHVQGEPAAVHQVIVNAPQTALLLCSR